MGTRQCTSTLHGETVEDGAPDASTEGMFEGVRTRTELEDWVYAAEYAVPLLRRQLGVLSLEGMGLGGHETAAVAAGALVHYLQKTMQGGLEHIDAIRFYAHDEGLTLDAVSVRNLELVEPLFSGDRRRRRCSIRWTPARRQWEDGCCGRRCCVRRRSWERLRRGWMRWARRRAI